MINEFYSARQRVGWYKTVIRNAGIRVNRKYERWEKESLTLDNDSEHHAVADKLQSEDAMNEFQDVDLSVILESLPTRERFVIRKMYVQGYTQREIATMLNLSQSEVSKCHKRALGRLKEMYL